MCNFNLVVNQGIALDTTMDIMMGEMTAVGGRNGEGNLELKSE